MTARQVCLRVLLAIVVAGCSTSRMSTTASGQPVKTSLFATYDRVRGTTDVAIPIFYKVPMLGPAVGLTIHAFHPDTSFTDPLSRVLVVFESTSGTQTDGWRFLKNNDLVLLLNGTERIALEGAHDGDVGSILIKEVIAFRMSAAELQRVASARTVEGVLGSWRFELKPDEIAKVREMAMYIAKDPNAPVPLRYIR
jgi:hypothetical protein